MFTSWKEIINTEKKKPYFCKLKKFIDKEYEQSIIYPLKKHIFNAFNMTPYNDVKVVILGQDPYHGLEQAHGLSFSIASPTAVFAPSLKNIFKELSTDLNINRTTKNLSDWAAQGVLLLNTVLTVRAGKAASHKNMGWEIFTDTIIKHLNNKNKQIIFVLWGTDARKKTSFLTNPIHKIIESAHPSPLSAHNGFFNSKPFSKINQYLIDSKEKPIIW